MRFCRSQARRLIGDGRAHLATHGIGLNEFAGEDYARNDRTEPSHTAGTRIAARSPQRQCRARGTGHDHEESGSFSRTLPNDIEPDEDGQQHCRRVADNQPKKAKAEGCHHCLGVAHDEQSKVEGYSTGHTDRDKLVNQLGTRFLRCWEGLQGQRRCTWR